MSRRGGGRPRRNDGGDRSESGYNEHDNRSRNKKNSRRVSFKPSPGGHYGPWNPAYKKLYDDDVDMNDHAVVVSLGRGRRGFRDGFRGRGRGKDGRVDSPAPRQPHAHPQRKLAPGTSPWYQVTIPYGQKHEKTFLLKALLTSLAPDVFVPHYYTVAGNSAVFYVDDFRAAELLFNADRKITMPDGFRLAVRVKSGTPQVNLDATLVEKMKLAMGPRYNAVNKALDLTKFHADPALADAFCPLFRPTVMLAALNMISENIPDLVALNLNDNKLQSIDQNISKKLPNLKILYLANNRIPHVNALETIKTLPIVDIYLEGNPLADRFKEKDAYIREVRKRCPKLLKLDGADLPPVIGFDVSDEINIPPSRPSFLCNPEGQTIVRQFLEQYFALYDSESRQPLLDAYHENATFSMAATYNQAPTQSNPGNRLNAYISNSRNLLRLQDRDVRRRHLKCGRLQVVSFLNDLPKTQHDPLSFNVDLTIYTPTLMMLTVNGVFKELSNPSDSNKPSTPPLRSFHKTMIIVPYGSGFCIQNDILTISNATATQERKTFKPNDVQQITNMPPPAYTPSVAPPQVLMPPGTPTPEIKQQLVQTLALQTNMNLEWSTNCLEQTHWDLQRALIVFTQLHKQGSIPPEAFIK